MNEPFQYDVFISHNSRDKLLEDLGLCVKEFDRCVVVPDSIFEYLSALRAT